MSKSNRNTLIIAIIVLIAVLVIGFVLLRANFQSSYTNAQSQMENRALTVEAQVRATQNASP